MFLTLDLEPDLGSVQGEGEDVGDAGGGPRGHQLHGEAGPGGGAYLPR